jgi:hypothetical protein
VERLGELIHDIRTAIRIDVHDAEYWDTPGGKIASLLQLAKAAITGNREDMDEDNVKVRMD